MFFQFMKILEYYIWGISMSDYIGIIWCKSRFHKYLFFYVNFFGMLPRKIYQILCNNCMKGYFLWLCEGVDINVKCMYRGSDLFPMGQEKKICTKLNGVCNIK